ncbi:hypothetical protein FQN49_001826 [Arthroderma sp. PD_2]|nr:hypothetical protein FQN49_001826 [Arthroderma sp. PD_2]
MTLWLAIAFLNLLELDIESIHAGQDMEERTTHARNFNKSQIQMRCPPDNIRLWGRRAWTPPTSDFPKRAYLFNMVRRHIQENTVGDMCEGSTDILQQLTRRFVIQRKADDIWFTSTILSLPPMEHKDVQVTFPIHIYMPLSQL